jgi:hypothetical protein
VALNTSFRRERRTSIVLAFDAAVLDGDAVVLDLIHFTQPTAECRNEMRMDPAMRLEEPDRSLLRVLGERPRRPPRRDMNSRRFIMRNSTRLIAVYPGWSGLKANIWPGGVQPEPCGPTTDPASAPGTFET